MNVRSTGSVIVIASCLAFVGCVSMDSDARYDQQYVRAVSRPVLACDNAERCARGMESDLLTDTRISEADRSAVGATVQDLRAAVRSDPRALENPQDHQADSIRFAEMVNAKVDEALSQWNDINARYGRLKHE